MNLAPSPRPWALIVFDIDGVVRDVGGSYRRAIADTVENFTEGAYRPTSPEIDQLKSEGCWNNDWLASQELIWRYFKQQGANHDHLEHPSYAEIISFFQGRYRGTEANPADWSGYITQEPLLMSLEYLQSLTTAGLGWGFFSGATRGSAQYILEKRLGLEDPVLIAMEDAPSKPDPTGLLQAIQILEQRHALTSMLPVLYVGDTVGDIHTIEQARQFDPIRLWRAIGVLPPHVQETQQRQVAYQETLQRAGADLVLPGVEALSPALIQSLIESSDSRSC